MIALAVPEAPSTGADVLTRAAALLPWTAPRTVLDCGDVHAALVMAVQRERPGIDHTAAFALADEAVDMLVGYLVDEGLADAGGSAGRELRLWVWGRPISEVVGVLRAAAAHYRRALAAELAVAR